MHIPLDPMSLHPLPLHLIGLQCLLLLTLLHGRLHEVLLASLCCQGTAAAVLLLVHLLGY
jgi:hypothetical protein